ncbi:MULTISPECIES: winged helix-turn-helix transcriptional regulator [unclassified Streptomyces]|uniref:winged helix-turn-helix transcriptional regulator n=1 Tax=unclassified Streptomyces TaxID=2593676 RepID=UPI001F45E094|nr:MULTISPECIES: winged helix-turn-helix transcriptional regulator [unclassified Streptomyces]
MTLAQVRGPVRVRDVAAQLPFVSEQFVGKRLATMHADGLVVRGYDRRGAPYQLSALGTSLAPVLRTVSDWSRTHLTQEPMAEAERVEDALRRLHLRHSTAVVQALDSADGQMRFVHIAEAAGLDYGLARQRLVRLQADGLVTRTGLPARRPVRAHRCRPGVGGRLRECRALEPALLAARWNSGTASDSGSHADPRRRSAGGGSRERPDRGGPTTERRRVERHVQPRASAGTAGAGGRDRSVGTGPGPVTAVRTRGHSPPLRHPRALRRLPPLHTRIRSPPSLPETRPCTPLMTRPGTKRYWSAPCIWLVPTGPARLASRPSPTGPISTLMRAPASSS